MGAESRSRGTRPEPAARALPTSHSRAWGLSSLATAWDGAEPRGVPAVLLQAGKPPPAVSASPEPWQQELLRPMAPLPHEWRREGFLFKCGTQGFCKPGRGEDLGEK